MENPALSEVTQDYIARDWSDMIATYLTSSIDDRRVIVEMHSQTGDWEVETIIGKSWRRIIVSIVNRKTAQAVGKAMATHYPIRIFHVK